MRSETTGVEVMVVVMTGEPFEFELCIGTMIDRVSVLAKRIVAGHNHGTHNLVASLNEILEIFALNRLHGPDCHDERLNMMVGHDASPFRHLRPVFAKDSHDKLLWIE